MTEEEKNIRVSALTNGWIWNGKKYAEIRIRKKVRFVHMILFELIYGCPTKVKACNVQKNHRIMFCSM